MKLIEEFDEICKKIKDHVGYDGFIENYQIDTTDRDCFWKSYNEDGEISWADTKEDILEDTGNQYESETRGIWRGKEITLALVESDFDSELHCLVLDSSKEIK